MGSYNTSSYLKLQTSNARIAVDVAMNNEDLTKPTELILKTSNGYDYYMRLVRPVFTDFICVRQCDRVEY